MSKKTCPVCEKPLGLRQINLQTAIYICNDLNCKYPCGFECIEVRRTLEELKTEPKSSENDKKDDIDDWMTNFLNGEFEKQTTTRATTPSQAIEAREDTKNVNNIDCNFMDDYNDLLKFLDNG